MMDDLTTDRVASTGEVRTAVALFPDRDAADRAIRALHHAGFGAGIGAATGGMLGALVGMGIPDDDARHFERGVHAGGVLVTVDEPARLAEARTVLHANGGDLASAGRGADTTAAAPRADYTSTSGALTGSSFDVASPVVGEPAAWSGIERRQPARRDRRPNDHL